MRYVQRRVERESLEDRVERALERGFCAIVGFPGIGKTTTARYVSARLIEKGKNVVWIIPDPKGEFGVNVTIRPLIFEEGLGGSVAEIRVNQRYANIWRFYDFLWIIAHVAENSDKYAKELEKFLKRFYGWLRKRKKDLAEKVLKSGEKLHIASLTGVHMVEFTEAMSEFLRDEGLAGLIDGMRDLGEVIADFLNQRPSGILAIIRDKMRDAARNFKLLGQITRGIMDIMKGLGEGRIGIEEIARYGAVFVFGLLGITGIIEFISLIREEREERKREHIHAIVVEKLRSVRDKVVFVVDDLEDAMNWEVMRSAFQEIVEIIIKAECPLLVIRRFSTTLSNLQAGFIEEILGVVGGAEQFSGFLRKETILDILGMRELEITPKIDREQIVLMLTTEYEEFAEIIRANVPEEKIEEEEMENLWKRFCMNPHLAIALIRHGVKIGDLKEPYYHKKSVEEFSKEDIEQMISWQIIGFKLLYDRIRKYKPYIIPLSFHPVAEDEMRRFLEAFTDTPKYFIEELKGTAGKSEVLVYEEEYKEGRRKVYHLDEESRKLGIYFESLAELDEDYLKRITKIRFELLKMMTDDFEREGGFNARMATSSIEDAEFLLNHKNVIEDIGASEDELKDILLLWARIGIEFNILKLDHIPLAFEKLESENPAYALLYLRVLAEYLGVSGMETNIVVEILMMILENLLNFRPKSDRELAIWLEAIASSVHSLIYTGVYGNMGAFDVLVNIASEIKSETLRKLMLAILKIKKAESLLKFDLKEAEELCYEADGMLEEIKGLDEEAEKYLKLLGVKPEEALKFLLSHYKGTIYHVLGIIQLNFGEESCKESFEKAFKIFDEITEFSNAVISLGFMRKAEVCLCWSFGKKINLEDLREYFEEYKEICPPETFSGINAELAVAEALSGGDVTEFAEKVFISKDRSLMLSVLALLGVWDKKEAEEELKKVDKEYSKIWIRDLEKLERGTVNPDWDKLLREFAEISGISVREALEIFKAYVDEDDRLEDMLTSLRPVDSFHSVVRILRLYLEGNAENAMKIAELDSKEYSPLLNKLFSQVADSIKNDRKEKFVEAIVKLFFLYV